VDRGAVEIDDDAAVRKETRPVREIADSVVNLKISCHTLPRVQKLVFLFWKFGKDLAMNFGKPVKG